MLLIDICQKEVKDCDARKNKHINCTSVIKILAIFAFESAWK